MDWWDLVEKLFSGDDSPTGGAPPAQFALNVWAAQVPYIGPYLGMYLTGRDDLSDLTNNPYDPGEAPAESETPRADDWVMDRSGLVQVASASDDDPPSRTSSLLDDPNLLADNSSGWSEADLFKPEQLGPVRPERAMDFGPPPRSQVPTPAPSPEPMQEVIVRGQRPNRSSSPSAGSSPPSGAVWFGSTVRPAPYSPVSSGAFSQRPLQPHDPTPLEIWQYWNGETPAEMIEHVQRPELSYEPPPERTFWNRGGAGLIFGGVAAVGGAVLILSNPVGWVVGLTGALLLAGGVAATANSAVQLGDSYVGGASAEQDAAATRATDVVLGISSPGGLLGGVAGTVYTGDVEGLETGAFWGGLAEGTGSMAKGIGQAAWRERQFGNALRQLGRDPNAMNWKWDNVLEANQIVFDFPASPLRQRPSPLFARNRELRELSHWISKNPRTGFWGQVRTTVGNQRYWRWVNRPWNLKPMWSLEHAMVDPQRFRFIKRAYKAAYQGQQLRGVERWAELTPRWAIETGYGVSRIGLAAEADRNNAARFTWISGLSLSPAPFLVLPEDGLDPEDAEDGPDFFVDPDENQAGQTP